MKTRMGGQVVVAGVGYEAGYGPCMGLGIVLRMGIEMGHAAIKCLKTKL